MTTLGPIWRALASHPEYEVSSDGRVRSRTRVQVVPCRWGGMVAKRLQSRELVPWLTNSGYFMVTLGREYRAYVHRLVADAFLPADDSLPVINHLNGNRIDNAATNLERTTHSQNMKHAHYVLGRLGGKFGPGRVRYARGAQRCA